MARILIITTLLACHLIPIAFSGYGAGPPAAAPSPSASPSPSSGWGNPPTTTPGWGNSPTTTPGWGSNNEVKPINRFYSFDPKRVPLAYGKGGSASSWTPSNPPSSYSWPSTGWAQTNGLWKNYIESSRGGSSGGPQQHPLSQGWSWSKPQPPTPPRPPPPPPRPSGWGATPSPKPSGWGRPPPPKPPMNGWGTPRPQPPTPGWGNSPSPKPSPPMGGWVQHRPPPPPPKPSGWGRPNPPPPPPPKPSGWGMSRPSPPPPSNGWGQSPRPMPPKKQGWGQDSGFPPPPTNQYPPKNDNGWGSNALPGGTQSTWGQQGGSQQGKCNEQESSSAMMTPLDQYYYSATPWPQRYADEVMRKVMMGVADSRASSQRSFASYQGYKSPQNRNSY